MVSKLRTVRIEVVLGGTPMPDRDTAELGSDPHYRDIVLGTMQGIIIQQDERIVFANPAMAKLFAYETPEEMIGLNPFEDLIDEADLSEFRTRTAAVYRNEKVTPHPGWKAKRRDREDVWIASTAHRTEWRDRPAVASFYLDITARHKTELALRESEARYRAALVAGRMGAWETDLIAKTRIWTPEGMNLFGLSLPYGLGTVGGVDDEYLLAIHPDDRQAVPSFYKQADVTDEFPAEYRIVRPDGQLLWLSGRGHVVSRTDDGRPRRLISIMADVTERKAAERRVETLMHELAHRSANLIAVVQSISRRIGRSSGSLKEFFAQFETRLQALATSHAALARQSWAVASLHDLITEQLRPFLPETGAAPAIEGPDISLPADGAQMLGLAIHELATNAVKHGAWSGSEGTITIRWRLEDQGGETPHVCLIWSEHGASSHPRSSREGFGHEILYKSVPQALRGTANGEFCAEGFRWTIRFPKPDSVF